MASSDATQVRREPKGAGLGDEPGRAASGPAEPGQGIVLRTGFFVLDWTLNFTRPTAIVDGRSYRLPWGEQFIPLAAGRHALEISYPWLGLFQAGKASVLVDIVPNQIVTASYRAPSSVLVAFRPGRLRLESSGPS
jgi:hypothetical protein